MISAVVKTAFVMEVLQLIAGVVGQSPCPTIFWYNYNPSGSEMIGHAQILSPPKGVPIMFSLTLNFADPTSTFQREKNQLRLAASEKDAIKTINEGKPLMYEIYFSMCNNMVPLITDLKLNGKVLCHGSLPIAKNIISVVLSHTLDVSNYTKTYNRTIVDDYRSNTNRNVSLPASGAETCLSSGLRIITMFVIFMACIL